MPRQGFLDFEILLKLTIGYINFLAKKCQLLFPLLYNKQTNILAQKKFGL